MRTRISTLIFLSMAMALAMTLAEGGFVCNSTISTCQALVDYKPYNDTNISSIATLFNLGSIYDISGANNWTNISSSSITNSTTIKAGERVRVPVACKCVDGIGASHQVNYTVKQDNTLDGIAKLLFSGLVTFQQIADASKIPNPDRILVGQVVVIPLPCSCDPVSGSKVVHFAYLVPSGSTVSAIAAEHNTTEPIILSLNNMTDAKDLKADQVLDVPLKVCSSTIKETAVDASLLVPSGTYSLTANNCVMCSCGDLYPQLQCGASPLAISTCPLMRCTGTDLYISNSTSVNNCPATCSYAGYMENKTILTSIVSEPSCNSAGLNFKGRRWWGLFISLGLQFGLFWVGFLC